jgi:hypothetical protein
MFNYPKADKRILGFIAKIPYAFLAFPIRGEI